jgi:hypothetical protein
MALGNLPQTLKLKAQSKTKLVVSKTVSTTFVTDKLKRKENTTNVDGSSLM